MKKVLTILGLITIATPTLAFTPGTTSYQAFYEIIYEDSIADGVSVSEAKCLAKCLATKLDDELLAQDDVTIEKVGIRCGMQCAK